MGFNDDKHDRLGRQLLAMATLASALLTSHVTQAAQDRPPVVLDTQTGIHDGRAGTVLQTAPLAPMPSDRPNDRHGDSTDGQSPVIVSPYLQLTPPARASTSRVMPSGR
ncbi:MAG: hypothetical protein GAK40_00928 [Burkholderia plantarii]|nr:MAG: hypothetical protein GAK40_00928 [Burkholderia plantarii]